MRAFLLILSCAVLVSSEITEPDVIRNVYLRTEKSLWENVVKSPSNSRVDRLKLIFTDHNKFVDSNLKNYLDIDDLKMLIKLNGWHNLESEIINVHRMFITFQQHLSRETKYVNRGEFNEDVSLDLTEHVLDDSNWPLVEAIGNLNNVIVQEKLYLPQLSDLASTSCTIERSAHQMIYQLYNAITVIQLEAYVMMQCSYMLRNAYKKGDFFAEADSLRQNFEQKIVDSLESAKDVFSRADRSIHRCDPESYENGKTYLEITRLLQGHIENEADLNSERTCVDTCDNYQFVEKSFGCSEGSICNRQPRCQGTILSCSTVEDKMWICPSNKTSMRTYEYIVYPDRTLGAARYCNPGFHVEKSWSYMLIYRCDHCFCICDEQGKKSDRFFSIREAVSDTKSNMVVTGVRFVKHNRIIHLQVQESLLLKFGKVDKNSSRWVPIKPFSILDKGVKTGVDYHTLAFDQREFDLDDVIAQAGHVVTGVKLRILGKHLNLAVRVSEINFNSGTVDTDKSFWVSNDHTEVSSGKDRRSEITMKWPNVPTRTRKPSALVSESNSFIRFTHSDIGKDAAQSTVPFLDSQDVYSTPGSPLQGVGLYYKSQWGYGGFIAPKIETLDYTNYIKSNLQNFKKAF